MNAIIQMTHLTKSYSNVHAVQNVSLDIKKGEIYGLIGLNGAGKTTLIRMLLGMIRPTQGSCFINGENVQTSPPSIWEKVGYIVETPHAYPELTVKENLDIYRQLHLISSKERVTTILDHLNLTKYADRKAKKLSLGNVQRLGIAKALLHRPSVLVLDEPTNGLDPAGTVEMRKLLQQLATQSDVTILVSSHLLSEVAKIATKVGILHEGQLIQEMEAENVSQSLKRHLLVHTTNNVEAVRHLQTAHYSAEINKQHDIEIYDEEAVLSPENVSRMLVYKGVPAKKLVIKEEDLETYFLRLIKKKEG